MPEIPESLQLLAERWKPLFVFRNEVGEFSERLLHPRTMSNLDSKGLGPRRIRVGKRVAYSKDDLVRWMAARVA